MSSILISASDPSPWVVRWLPEIPRSAPVFDVACGSGRHARLLARAGYRVVAIDRDATALSSLAGEPGVETLAFDLEAGAWPFSAGIAAGVVVTNYLHRPLMAALVAALAPGGVLVYETFARGNERFGRPSNPDFLLEPGELLRATTPELRVLAYEDLTLGPPRPSAVQRIAARREPR